MNRDYYIFSNGCIKRKDNTLYYINSDGIKRALPVEQIDKIHIFGEVDLNTKFFNYLTSYGILINIYNYYGYYAGTYYPRESNVSGYVKVKQAINYYYDDKRIYLAKCFIDSAAHHILRNLNRYNIDESIIEKVKQEREKVLQAKFIDELMGAEGRMRMHYYEAFNNILKNFSFDKREKRPPKDPVNALISFGNGVMYTTVLGEIYKTQLDPTISFLHEPSTRRFSLSLDLAEIFKPLIIDPVIFTVINNKIINKKDFDIHDGICFLNDNGKKKFIFELEKKLNTTVKHRKLKRNVSYKMFIRLECYKLIKHFIGDDIYKPLKAWW